MNFNRLRFATSVCLLALVSTAAPAADAPWDGVPFSADPKAVLEAASRVPAKEDEGVVVLLDEARYVFDSSGAMQRTEYLVYRVADEAAAEGWASIEVPWSPWYTETPVVDARVITKEGTVHRLDPKSFGTADAPDEPSMFTDTRMLHGPLPAVAAGSVVEQTIVWKQKNSILGAGVTHRHSFGRWVGTTRSRLVLEYPSTVTVKVANRTQPVIEPEKSTTEGVTRIVYETGPLPALEFTEWNLPSDVSLRSSVTFSTGISWADLANRYAEVVDRQIGTDPLPKVPGIHAGSTPREIAAQILAKVEQGIRYAGVEFGEGSIIPRTPRETLTNKYGDCKDKAILLVAMLRQAGIPAHVALLVAGQGPDVERELPGLGQFNHVIVVAGNDDDRFWIDPTDEFARAGELPVQDQGRLALIASPATTELVLTPESDAEANRTIEMREFFLAEAGNARVVERAEYHGQAERNSRRDYADANAESIRKGLKQYVVDGYLAKDLGKFTTSDPRDLSTPFLIEVEAVEAGRGITTGGEAAVGIFLSHLTAELPWDLRPSGDEETEKERKARVHDYILATPLVREFRYRIHPPAGYTLRTEPFDTTENLGPMTLAKKLAPETDGTVSATFRLTAGPRRLTPAQYEAARTAIGKLEEQPALLIMFDQIGERHLQKGEIGEAIREFGRWTAAHPKEASHHSDMARALLAAGLGNEARREARRAVEIEPKSPQAHAILGRMLIQDEIGRELVKGCDVPGAIVAYRKAKELDPTNVAVRAELAYVLEHNDAGVKHGKGARLADAIAEWEAMKTEVEANDAYVDRQLMTLYARTNAWAKLKSLTEETTDTEQKEGHRILAVAMLEGAPAALEAARSIEPAARRTAIAQAGSMLAVQRSYPEAVVLLEAAAQGAPNASALRQQIDILRKTRRLDAAELDREDPTMLVVRLFMGLRSADPRRELEPLLVREAFTVFDDPDEDISNVIDEDDPLNDFYMDIAAASFDIQKDGDEQTGIRIRNRAAKPGSDMTVFAVKENGEWKLAGGNFSREMLGLRALRLAQAGELEAARQWLDWARDLVDANSGDDPVVSNAFAALWTRGRAADRQTIELAAAALLPDTKKSAELALPLLHAARAKASDDVKWRIDQVLAESYRITENWVASLAAADRLLVRYPDSRAAFGMAMLALKELGRNDEMKDRAQQRLLRLKDDVAALRTLSELARDAGQHDLAAQYRAQIIATSADPEPADYNNHAWSALFAGTNLDDAIAHAQRAVTIAPESYPSLNTLAVLYAEQNSSTEAREVLLRSLVAKDDDLEGADWYVVGRIAENYGLREPAIDAYRRIERPERVEGTSWQLAQKRLAHLAPEAKAKRGKK